jgi:hypothetical protein
MSQVRIDAAGEPVACTLGTGELGLQVERWTTLYAAAGTERAVTGDGLQLHFRRDPVVERELRDLVAVEVECCKWARWTVEASPDELILEVGSTGEGVALIQSWFVGGAAQRWPTADRAQGLRSRA